MRGISRKDKQRHSCGSRNPDAVPAKAGGYSKSTGFRVRHGMTEKGFRMTEKLRGNPPLADRY